MAASQEQKVDFLLKKIGYVQSKTGIAEDASGISGTKKAPTEENKPSPLVVSSTSVWADSTFVPASPPTSNTTYVGIYTATNAFRLTHDNTVTGNRTFIARSTFGNQTASISGDWIDPSFGADYAVQVYKGDPNSGGVSLSPTGSGNSDEWFFDYSSGILNFNGTNVPSGITTSNVYLIGYKYLGAKGVLPPAGRSNLNTLSVSGLSTFTGNVDANGDLDVDGRTELDITNISETLNVVGIATFANNIDANGDLDVDGRTELDITNISETLNVVGISTFASDIDINASIDVDGHTELDDVNVSTALTANNLVVTGSTLLKHSNSLKLQTTGIGVSVSNGVGLTATIAGPTNLIIDPGVVGDNTGIVRIKGDLFVDGTQTQINSTTIELADFIVGVATTATSDLLSDGAGIQIGPNNTFLYEFNGGTNPSLKSSENLNVASGKVYQIDQTEILSATTLGSSVVNSSLTNLGTLTSLTVSGAIDANGDLDVDGQTDLDVLNVAETATFSSDVVLNANLDLQDNDQILIGTGDDLKIYHDGSQSYIGADDLRLVNNSISETYATFANNGSVALYYDNNKKFETTAAGIEVTGHSELDHVNVSAASTFAGLVDINAGAQVNTLKVEDLTDNRVVIAGTGGEIEDSANLTFDGTTLALTGNQTVSGTIDVDGQAIFDDITVSAASTFTGNIDANGNLDVDGQTDLDVLNVAETATFSSNIDANGDLDVDGRTELDITNISETLNVVGVATFANNIDANGDLDVDGRTELDITNISETLNVTGIATFANNIDANGDLDVDGTTELDVLNVAETATFSSNIDANGDLDVDGRTELDITNISETLNVTGITTFENNVNVGGALSVTGNSYFGGNIVLGDAATDNVVFNADVNSNIIPNTNNAYDLGSSSQEWKDLYLNGIAYIDTLQVHEGSTFTGNIDANGDLDVDGRTELDITNISETLNVVGISTFAANADFNGSIDVDGHTELDDVNVSGASTFGGLVDINAGAQVNTLKVEDLTDNRVVIAGVGGELEDSGNLIFTHNGTLLALTGNQTISGNIDVDGQAIFDDITVSAASTFAGLVDINAGAQANTFKVEDLTSGRVVLAGTGGELEDSGNLTFNGTLLALTGNQTVSGTIDVDGQAIFDDITVSAASTFTGSIDANGDLDVDGRTELDITNISETLNVVGIATFANNIDANGDLDVDGHTELDNLKVTGVSTFANNIDANGNLDVDGQTDLDALNVTDTATFTGLVDIDAGGQANTFKVEDLTDNRVVIAGTGGELEDDANLTFDGTRLALGVGLIVTGVSTFTGHIDANGNLDVDGHTELDNVNVAGFSTFSHLVDVNANLTVNQDLTVEGSVGIASLIPSAKLDVVGLTKLDDVNVSGASTFTGHIDANGNLDVDGQTDLDALNVSDTATFTSNIDANGDLDVDGRTELDITNISETLNVTGITTFASNVDLNANLDISGDIDVDGHTELDNVNISGVVTATAFHTGAEGSAIRVTSNTISGPAEIVIDPAAVGDNTGALRIKGDLFVDGTQTQINSTTIELADFIVGIATTATSDALADGAGIQIGPNNTLLYDHTNTSLKSSENLNLTTGKTYKINGTDVLSATTLGSNVVNSSLTNLGTLTALTVSGAIDANGDLDVDGHTELDNLKVTGVSTFSGNLNLSGNITSNLTIVSTNAGSSAAPEFKLYRNSASPADADYLGQIKFAGENDNDEEINYAKITGKILDASDGTEDGIIEFAHIKAGTQTITGRWRSDSLQLLNSTNLSVNGNTDLTGYLDVDGQTDLDVLNVSDTATFTGNAIFDSTGSIQIPKGTTGQRLTGVVGQIRYNTQLSQFEGYGEGNQWGSLGGVKDVDGDTFVTAEASAGNDDDVLSFHTAGSIRVAISSTGQVGIGSTIPAATLDVIGDTRLTGILTVTNGIDGIGIQSEGTSITTGIVTTINFVGSAISAITNTNGLVEIDLKGGTFSRSTTSFTATAGQTSFSLTYTPNFIDVYHNGVRLTASEFTATNGTSVVLTEGAFVGDTIDIVVFQNSALFNTSKWSLVDTTNESGDIFRDTNVGIGTTKPTDAAHASNTKILNVGVVTANNLYGALTGNVTGNVTGTADLASGLTGTPNITVGTINASTISVAGTITYDDVSNVDSVGLVTARTGIRITEGGLIVTAGVSTFTDDVSFGSTISLGDNDRLRIGDDNDLQIFHSGTSSFIQQTGTGNLFIINSQDDQDVVITSDDGSGGTATYIRADGSNGETVLYHYGSEKLATKSNGIDVTGHIETDTLNVSGVSTFSAALDVNAAVNISGDLTIADKIVHDGDTNTTIRFPANDVVAIETAGTEKLRIDANGKVGIASDSPVARVDLEGTLGLEATTTTVSSTSATTIDTLPIATYRSAKFQIQVTQGTSYQTADLLVIHDGSIASSIEYASLSTSEELAVFTTEISGSNLLLQATMGSASSATVKVVRYGVTI